MSQAGEINASGGGSNLEELTPDVGGAVMAIADNINVLGYPYTTADGTIKPLETYNGTSNNFLLANNTFLTPLVVDPSTTPGAEGTFTTIGAAILAAESGQDIFIRSGTYTENVTLAAGVNLTAFEADDFTPQVTIIGTVTASYSGTVTCSDIRFQTNGSAAILLSGSNQTILSIVDSQIIATNSTGISLTNSNAGSSVRCYNCIFDTTTSGISVFTASSASTMFMEYCAEQNQAASNTASTLASTSGLTCRYSYFSHPITTSSSSYLNSLYCKYDLLSINATCLTLNGSTNNYSETDVFISGTASAISVGSALTMTNGMVYSTNTNAITGSGTLSYTPIAFAASSSTVNTTTQVQLGFGPFTNTDGVLYYDGAKPVTTTVGTAGEVLTSNGPGMAPTFQTSSAGTLITTYNSSTTWTPNARTETVDVIIFGGGAGGGSGHQGLTTSAGGGGGGGSSGIAVFGIPVGTFGSSASVTIAASANGGTGQSSASSNGITGAVGNLSGLGYVGTPTAGAAGVGGTTLGGGLGDSYFTVIPSPVTGIPIGSSSGSNGVPVNGPNIPYLYIGGGGGGGSGANSVTVKQAANAGNITDYTGLTTLVTGGTGGIESGTIGGGNGNPGFGTATQLVGGTGGGGGGGQSVGSAGGAGGNGGAPGGGGGGGGGTLNGTTSGAGGNGAIGQITVIEHF